MSSVSRVLDTPERRETVLEPNRPWKRHEELPNYMEAENAIQYT